MKKTPKRHNVTTAMPRRRLLQLGAGLAALPLLQACGESGMSAPAVLPTPPAPPTPASPAPTPAPSPAPAPAPSPAPAATPKSVVRGIHVSYTGDMVTGRTMTWFTDGLTDPGSIVEWGPVTAGMTAAQIAAAPLPMRTEGSASPAYGIEVLTHRVDLTNLPANAKIRYRVGGSTGFSDVRVLQPTPTEGFRFVHFGDASSSAAAQEVFKRTLDNAPDFFLIAGDLSYANGEQAVWDTWFDHLDPLASRIPMITCPGNHEAKDGGGLGYTSRVSQPDAETYYSFDVQRVHFCLSTAGCLLTEEDPSSAATLAAELAWIDADLAQAAAKRAAGLIDFIVFVQHYTIWTNDDSRSPGNASLIGLEEDILVRYGVDLLLVGHDHIYERSKPMAYGQPNPLGYVQITQGGGGQSLYGVLAEPASWSQLVLPRHGFSEYSVSDGKIEIRSWAVSDGEGKLLASPELIDSFTMSRRLPAAAAAFAQPKMGRRKVLANFDAIVEHTLRRNQLHDVAEMLHP